MRRRARELRGECGAEGEGGGRGEDGAEWAARSGRRGVGGAYRRLGGEGGMERAARTGEGGTAGAERVTRRGQHGEDGALDLRGVRGRERRSGAARVPEERHGGMRGRRERRRERRGEPARVGLSCGE